jgi:hypothetical protein
MSINMSSLGPSAVNMVLIGVIVVAVVIIVSAHYDVRVVRVEPVLNVSFAEFKAMAAVNHRNPIGLSLVKLPALAETTLPSYLKYKESLLVPVRTQGECSACWSFAVVDALADRISVYTNGAVRNSLSTQELLSCFYDHEGCNVGGSPETAYSYVIKNGIVEATEYLYEQENNMVIGRCKARKDGKRWYGQKHTDRSLCVDLYDMTPGTDAYEEALSQNIKNMKRELFLNGPFVGTIQVHADLYQYDGKSVYTVGKDSPEIGGHAIEVFGYCEESVNTGEKGFEGAYWVCRNSWSSHWISGLKEPYGFFYVKMGVNEAGIESRASCILPVIPKEIAVVDDLNVTRYISYDQYSSDPERQQYFGMIKK